MFRSSSNRLAVLIVLASCPSLSVGHPSTLENAHLHNSTTVKWSKNPLIKDGSVPHNHIANQQFGASALPGEAPFDVYTCWDDGNWRYNTKIGNNDAHCFIRGSTALDGAVPTFRFTGSNWTTERKEMVKDAIEAWEATFAVNYDVGLKLVEVPSSAASDIQIAWTTDSAQAGWWADLKILRFDHNLNWSYIKSATGAASSKWHFWTIAMHEIGHVLGFDHTTQSNSVMNLYLQNNVARVGRPKEVGGVHLAGLSSWDLSGAAYTYGQPSAPPTIASCDVHFVTCNGVTMMTAITPNINEPYFISNVHMDTAQSPSGPWTPRFDGPFTCPSYGASSSFWYRLIVTTAFGTATCMDQVYINPWDPCDEGW